MDEELEEDTIDSTMTSAASATGEEDIKPTSADEATVEAKALVPKLKPKAKLQTSPTYISAYSDSGRLRATVQRLDPAHEAARPQHATSPQAILSFSDQDGKPSIPAAQHAWMPTSQDTAQ